MARPTFMRYTSGYIFSTNFPHRRAGERMPYAEGREAYRQQCITSLRDYLPDDATVWCVLRHVSASGMSRRIDFYTIHDGDMRMLSGLIAGALDHAPMHATKPGLVISGCGMDMGFHVVDGVSRAIGRKLSHRWL